MTLAGLAVESYAILNTCITCEKPKVAPVFVFGSKTQLPLPPCLKIHNQFPLFSDIKNVLNGISVDIRSVAEYPITATLSNFTGYINDTETYIRRNLPKLEEYNAYW